MGAEFFSVDPRPIQAIPGRQEPRIATRLRQVHRWVSFAFTLTVAANFTAMIWGEPPPWITYSPLPPLMILLVTGLYMLGRHHISAWRGPVPVRSRG